MDEKESENQGSMIRNVGKTGAIVSDGPIAIRLSVDSTGSIKAAAMLHPGTRWAVYENEQVDRIPPVDFAAAHLLIQEKRGMKNMKLEAKVFLIFDLITKIMLVHKNWAESDREIPDLNYWQTVGLLFGDDDANRPAQWDRSNLPEFFRSPAAENLTATINAWQDSYIQYDMGDSPDPSEFGWYRTREQVELEVKRFLTYLNRQISVEPIQTLLELGTDPNQIAMMYELVIDNGIGVDPTPDIASLNKEIAKPGSVIKSDWKPKRERERLAIFNSWSNGLKQYEAAGGMDAILDQMDEDLAAANNPVATESWENLYDTLGYSFLDQAASMKQVSVEEARAKFEAIEKERASGLAGLIEDNTGAGDPESFGDFRDEPEYKQLDDKTVEDLKAVLTESQVAFNSKARKPELMALVYHLQQQSAPAV